MANAITLNNGRHWKFQKEAMQHFKSMLERYKDGDRISSPDDHGDLYALLERYDATLPAGYKTTIGVGIAYFSRQNNGKINLSTHGFHAHRLDGTSVGFSYMRAITARTLHR